MNKKFRTIAAGATVGILALTGCTEDTYGYEVSGTVEARQIDYDCPNEDVAMDAVAFVAGSGRGSGSGKSSKSSGKSSDAKSDKNSGSSDSVDRAPNSAPSSRSTKAPTTSSTTRPSTPATRASGGVKLKKKPAKPEKVKGDKAPKPLYAKKPKGCETEYELYVRNDDGLFEQDVRREDYDNCTEGEKFAACTES